MFLFRLVYGGSAYSYSVDPDFADVGFSQKKWQTVIDAFYEKYTGWRDWHKDLMYQATTTGQVVIPTGRVFKYEPVYKKGDIEWPRTTILNYPVQGLGADLMMLARISAHNRIKNAKLRGLLISTVHDSIVADCPDEETEEFCKIFHSVFNDVPANFERVFKKPFNLPMKAEVLYGPNLSKLTEYKWHKQ